MLPHTLFSFLLLASLSQAQGLAAPVSQRGIQPLLEEREVWTYDLPAVVLSSVIKEDADRRASGLPPRFALPRECSFTPSREGTWESLDAQTLLWRLRVRGAGALNLNLGFKSFYLPPSATLYVYSTDRTQVVRPFTAEDNAAHGELWTPVVNTDDLMVELEVAVSEVDQVRLELSQIGQGYRPFGAPGGNYLGSGSCNFDVICPEGDGWRLEIPSVGVISTGGSTFCTGFMVNNVRNDLRPYFMTAAHCGVGSGNAASLVVYWNYENSFCRPAGTPGAGGNGDGSLAEFNSGSFFRAAWSASDVTLVELDSDPPASFDVSYAGWDATGADATMAIAIHHPDTDEKRISYEFQPTTTTSYLQVSVPGNGTHVRVEDWDLGTTEPGSSGSPLFNQDHRVIGQLHGGFASCSSQTADWYGKFSVSWTGGGTSSTRLSNHLDPDSTGTLTVDSSSLATLCTDQGEFEFGQASYRCEDTLDILLTDCGLNTSDVVAETVTISVDSSTEPGGETVLLTETGPQTARFAGTLALSSTNGAGVLHVMEGDAVTARYTDADDGMGGSNVPVTGPVAIDCSPASVISVGVSAIGPDVATVTITANEGVTAGVDFGTSCGSLVQVQAGTDFGTTATVELSGLLPNTTYFFHALATDAAGNLTTDDNGGSCYSFSTDSVPIAFTEEFLGDTDFNDLVVVFRPDPGPDGYVVCTRQGSGLATNPAGGTTLSLFDDDSEQIVLGGGNTVKLYGQSYGSFWVNSNGSLTFNGGDTDYTESLTEHFGEPRISPYWDDFNPSVGGTVSYRELSDRVVVTWDGVPEYSTSNQNTFQVELFYSGRIRMSYASLDSTDGITGLSAGLGVPPSFFETDFSIQPACSSGGPQADRARGPRSGPTIQAR